MTIMLFNCQLSIVNCQLNDGQRSLMARAARAEGLDTTSAFQKSMEAYRASLLAQYTFDEEAAGEEARLVYDRLIHTQGDRQLQIRQVFHAFPQHVRQSEIYLWQQRMDSVSMALEGGADFQMMMSHYSDIQETVWLTRSQQTEELEQVAFSLQCGQISQPFLSPQGIHIVQLIDERQLSFDDFKADYFRQIKSSNQTNTVTDRAVNRLKTIYGFAENQQNVNLLYRNGKADGVLFTLDGKSFTGAQFAQFAQAYPMGIRRQYAAFVTLCVMDCHAGHLADSAEFQQELTDAGDRLLAMEAYRIHVTEPSQKNEAGLAAYFSNHQKDYHWQKPRFKGAVIHAVNKKVAKKVRKVIKKAKDVEWEAIERLLDDKSRSQVKVEQGMFEQGTNAFVDEMEFSGRKAEPLAGYPVVLTVGKKLNGPDDYREVLAQVQSDYRQYLENTWLESLRKQK